MKKDKLYELKISEEDEISGIDSISLVEEPAIEVNWVAFNKERKQEFVIPEGDDLRYSQMIMEKGELEEDLFNDGWEVYNGKDEFISSSPNSPSFEDTRKFLIRYKYIKNPLAPGTPTKETTREFCRNLLSKNLVYRVEDLDEIINDQGDSAMVWRGGYNCRHIWQQITYHKKTDIINKASVREGRVEGKESLDVMGLPQEDTRVPEWPSFSKQKFEAIDIYGFKPRYFHMCPGAVETFKHLISMNNDEDTIGMIRSAAQIADNVFRIEEEVIKSETATQDQLNQAMILVEDFKDLIEEINEESGMIHDVSYMDGHIKKIASYLKENLGYDNNLPSYVDQVSGETIEKSLVFETYDDYPESAKNNACKVLRWRDEHKDEVKGMTQVGWVRANQLCKGENISEETIARMASFARHRKNAEVSPELKDTPWKDAGYVAWLGWGGTTGIEWASNKLDSIRMEAMSKQMFKIDEEKRITLGPAMIPYKNIFRKDEFGNPYYVFFSPQTIKMIAEKYMKNKYIDNNDENHDGKAVSDVYVIESWIKEDEQDKSNKYGFGDLPIGTWFVSMKINNNEVWEKIKNGSLRGYSVSGYFEQIEKFTKEEMFLYQLAELLRNVQD